MDYNNDFIEQKTNKKGTFLSWVFVGGLQHWQLSIILSTANTL